MSLLGLRVKLKSDSPYIRSWHVMSHVMTTGVGCRMVTNIAGGIVVSTIAGSAVVSTIAGRTMVATITIAGRSVAPIMIKTTALRAGTLRSCCMSKSSTKLRGCRGMVVATIWGNRSCVNPTKMPVLVLVGIHKLWLRRTSTTPRRPVTAMLPSQHSIDNNFLHHYTNVLTLSVDI